MSGASERDERLRYIADRVQALGAIIDQYLGDDESVEAWVDELRQIANAIRQEANGA